MPTGPSHSGGGFGGHSSHSSHSSGGFSSGGGSSGFHRHTGPHRFHWFGRTVIISGGHYSSAVSFISVAIFLIIFSAFMGFMAYSNNTYINEYKASVVVFEEDAEFFENLIEKADKEDGYYLATANFDGQIYYDYEDYDLADSGAFIYDYYNNIPYFFIKYSYENLHHLDENDVPYIHYGETYAQFSSSAIAGMISVAEETGHIQIAYTYADGAWWSINTSYSLNDNIEYKLTLQEISDLEGSQKILMGIIIVFALIIVGCITGAVLKLVSGAKKAKAEAEFAEQKNEAELTEARARAEEAVADADRKQNYVCAYCGSDIPAGETKCPTCGSSKRTKK